MIPDEIDKFVLCEIFNAYKKKEDSNHWEITKKFAKTKNIKVSDMVEISKLYRKIKARLEKYCEAGIFFKSKNGDGDFVYTMDIDMVFIIKRKCSGGMKRGLWFKI